MSQVPYRLRYAARQRFRVKIYAQLLFKITHLVSPMAGTFITFKLLIVYFISILFLVLYFFFAMYIRTIYV